VAAREVVALAVAATVPVVVVKGLAMLAMVVAP